MLAQHKSRDADGAVLGNVWSMMYAPTKHHHLFINESITARLSMQIDAREEKREVDVKGSAGSCQIPKTTEGTCHSSQAMTVCLALLDGHT
jgi:hypothetical protein